MNSQEIIEVVQAWADGKQIQFCYKANPGNWHDVSSAPAWNFKACDYRIKPEPRIPIEVWGNIYPDGVRYFHYSLQAAKESNTSGMARTVHFREVIEDES